MSNVIYWQCHKCGIGIGKGETARCAEGKFWHVECYDKHKQGEDRKSFDKALDVQQRDWFRQ